MTTGGLREQASAIAGAGAVRATVGAHDAFDTVVPGLIVAPETAEAAAEILAWANRERLSVVISGGGSKSEWGRPPRQIDILLSMASLSRVIDHAHGDLTVTVEAGARLERVNAVLAAQRQFLPFDTAQPGRATLGGLVATNDSGPLRHRYGTPRDLVIGATLATTDGVLARSGGRVVKNVAGYDLARLMSGSHGSLAAIVSLTFKLFPQPSSTGTVELTGTPEALAAVWMGTRREQLEPMAVEAQAARGERASLLVRFGSDRATVERALDAVARIAREAGALCSPIAAAEEADRWAHHTARVWRERHVVRFSWAEADLPRVFGVLAALPHDVNWTFAGRAGVGSGHLGFGAEASVGAQIVSTLRAARELAQVTIVQGSPALRRAIEPWPASPPAATIWPSLKHSWDPANTLGADRGPI